MKKTIVLMGALDGEISTLKKNLNNTKQIKWLNFNFFEGFLSGVPVVVTKSGTGKVLSAMLTQHLIDYYDPTAIVFSGIAGSLKNKWKIGDIIAAKDTVQHDMDASFFKVPPGQIPGTDYRFIEADKELLTIALSCSVGKITPEQGRLLTGDQFVSDRNREDLNARFESLDGDAIDMESASVALVCHVNKTPHLILRTISDKADGTKINLREFLQKSSENSLKIIIEILEKLKQ